MNEHVKRPSRTERTGFGLKLTDAQPLSGIPALWRLAAMIATLMMGVYRADRGALFRPLRAAARGGRAHRRHHAQPGHRISARGSAIPVPVSAVD